MKHEIVTTRDEYKDGSAGAPVGPGQSRKAVGRTLVAFCGAAALVLLPVRTAQAAAPTNDNLANATVIPDVPFMDQVDTTEATTEPGDPECIFGNGPTVWYSYTPTSDLRVQMTTFGSNYDTTICVYAGTPASDPVASDDDSGGTFQSALAFDAIEGETYLVMVGAFDSGAGGNLTFNVDVAPPKLEIEFEIDAFGTVNPKTGETIVSGTVYCSRPLDFVDMFGDVEQEVLGHIPLTGFFYAGDVCDGEMAWSAVVDGAFKPGKLAVVGGACGGDYLEYTCGYVDEVIHLNGVKKKN